jgi:methionyl-tRNA formyltransferase
MGEHKYITANSDIEKYRRIHQDDPSLNINDMILKDESFLQELKTINADLFVVVAFRMLPEAVWNMPKHGTINLHASLLPNYRGAAPINWAVINGEKQTGVTTFFLKHEIDTGDIINQQKVAKQRNHRHDDEHNILYVKSISLQGLSEF